MLSICNVSVTIVYYIVQTIPIETQHNDSNKTQTEMAEIIICLWRSNGIL